MILRPDCQRPFQEESALFRAIDKATREEQHLEVYAPVVYADERDKKRRLGEFHQSIRQMAVKIAGTSAPQATTGEQP